MSRRGGLVPPAYYILEDPLELTPLPSPIPAWDRSGARLPSFGVGLKVR